MDTLKKEDKNHWRLFVPDEHCVKGLEVCIEATGDGIRIGGEMIFWTELYPLMIFWAELYPLLQKRTSEWVSINDDNQNIANAILQISARTDSTYEDILDAFKGIVLSEEECGDLRELIKEPSDG